MTLKPGKLVKVLMSFPVWTHRGKQTVAPETILMFLEKQYVSEINRDFYVFLFGEQIVTSTYVSPNINWVEKTLEVL